MPEPCALIGLQALKLHWTGILSELGRYGPGDRYDKQLVYETSAYRRLGIGGDCPVAEEAARRVRQGMDDCSSVYH